VAAALIGALWRRSALWGWRLCLWLPAPAAALIGGVALAAAYAVFSGWGVPAQRTIVMLATVAALRLSGRLALADGLAAGLRGRGRGGSLGADAGRLLAEFRRRRGVVCYGFRS
jgi:hypothetical protein